MTQALECQKCGEFIDTVLTDKDMIIYHKNCWVEFQQETIAVARGKKWYKLGETTECYEEDKDESDGREHEDHSWLK